MSVSRSIALLTSSSAINELATNSFLKDVKVHEGETILLNNPNNSNLNKSTESIENLNGINWYDYLVLHDDVMALMDEFSYEKLCKMFVVCCSLPWPNDKTKKPRRKFASFNSYSHFLEYIKSIPTNQWFFFEIIMAEHGQKLYFDIDIEKEKLPQGESLEAFSGKLLNSLISAITHCMLKYEIVVQLTKDLLIFSSNAAHKHSYHVILNNYFVMNNHCNTILCTEIKQEMSEVFREYIDEAVYSAKQQLRLYKSQKPGTGRVKELLSNYYYDIHKIEQVSKSFEDTFRSSCVTYTENCKVIPISHTIDKSVLVANESRNNQKLTDDDVKKIVKTVNPVVFKIYKMSRVIGRMILLQRIQKAHCSLCNRVHENENAFLSVGENWNVYFYCRRDESKSINMGYVVDNSESIEIANKVVKNLQNKLNQNSHNEIIVPTPVPKVENMSIDSIINSIPTIGTFPTIATTVISQSVVVPEKIIIKQQNLNSTYFNSKSAMPMILKQPSVHQKLREVSLQSK